jgi:hypothetical protein
MGPVEPDGRRPWWVMMATEVSHCGAGCVLGDVISEFAIFWLALTVAGQAWPAEYIGDYVLALAFGIVFQYFAIAPMRGLGLGGGQGRFHRLRRRDAPVFRPGTNTAPHSACHVHISGYDRIRFPVMRTAYKCRAYPDPE